MDNGVRFGGRGQRPCFGIASVVDRSATGNKQVLRKRNSLVAVVNAPRSGLESAGQMHVVVTVDVAVDDAHKVCGGLQLAAYLLPAARAMNGVQRIQQRPAVFRVV